MATRNQDEQPLVYQLKVTLNNVEPPIWRRIQVPADVPLDVLHTILQFTMGWEDYHLHAFRVGDRTYAPINAADPYGSDDKDEMDYTLVEIAPTEGASFQYDYDLGDTWEHTVQVEKVLPADSAVEYPICLDGARACPPEDSGGPWGYAAKLEILKDRKHSEHRQIKEWMGDDFDPEAFSIDDVNDMLVDLDEYLAEVEMLDDGLPVLTDEEMEEIRVDGLAQLGQMVQRVERQPDGLVLHLEHTAVAATLSFQLILFEHERLPDLRFVLEVDPGSTPIRLRISGPAKSMKQIQESLNLRSSLQ